MHIKLKTGEYLLMAHVEMASGTEYRLFIGSREKATAMVEILLTKMAEHLGVLHG